MRSSTQVHPKLRRCTWHAAAALALLPGLAAQVAAQETGAQPDASVPVVAPLRTTAAPAAVAAAAAGYRVGVGDELNFRFTYTPELSTVAVVRADGKVSLPLLGEVQAAGMNLRQLTDQVQGALSHRLRRPDVVINVQGNMPSQRVFVGGEVGKPGVQQLAGSLTAMQAVLAADGLKDTAQPREVIVLRNVPGGERQVLRVDLKGLMEGDPTAQDVALTAYDVVIVPRSGVANVGLWVDQYIRRVLPVSLGFNYSLGSGAIR